MAAEDNNNITSVNYESDSVEVSDSADAQLLTSHEDDNLESSDGDVLSAGNNIVNVRVFDSYNETNKNWDMDGVAVNGATVELFDSSNHSVKTAKTNSQLTKQLSSNSTPESISILTIAALRLSRL